MSAQLVEALGAVLSGAVGVDERRSTVQPLTLECECNPKVNTRGRTQRAIVDYLATAPAGFSGPIVWSSVGGPVERHGPPYAVPVAHVVRAVYRTEQPSGGQTRTVQRAVAQLRHRGVVWGRNGWIGVRERAYVTRRGFTADMPVSALYVALVWHCPHLNGGAA